MQSECLIPIRTSESTFCCKLICRKCSYYLKLMHLWACDILVLKSPVFQHCCVHCGKVINTIFKYFFFTYMTAFLCYLALIMVTFNLVTLLLSRQAHGLIGNTNIDYWHLIKKYLFFHFIERSVLFIWHPYPAQLSSSPSLPPYSLNSPSSRSGLLPAHFSPYRYFPSQREDGREKQRNERGGRRWWRGRRGIRDWPLEV